MTDDTLHTLHTADIAQHSPYRLLPPSFLPHLSIWLLPHPNVLPPAHHCHHPPLHASIHCLFLCQCVFFSSIESRARYVNEVNRIVACGEAAQLSQKFPVHFTLIQSAVVLSFWCVCMYVCACRDTRCVCVFCLCLRVWMRSSPSAALPAVWQKLAIIIFAALPPSAAGINVGPN